MLYSKFMIRLHYPTFPTKSQIRLWLALLICSLFSLADVIEFATMQPDALLSLTGLICLAIFKATLFIGLDALAEKKRIGRAIVLSVIIFFILLSLFSGLSWFFYGFGISRKLATIIFETNRREIAEFIPELTAKFTSILLSLHTISIILIFLILWFTLPHIPRKIFTGVVSLLSILGLGYLCFMIVTADFGRANHLIFVRTYRCVRAHIHDSAQIKKLLALKSELPDKESAISLNRANRIVVVIGESASRDHLSLYGYPLPTTPRLDSINDGLYIFTDAIASSTSTAQNLPRLLTFMTDEPDVREWYEYPTLLQLFKTLGYHTYWLSNQEKTGEWSNLSGILSSDADIVKYLGSENSEDHYLYRYDDVLIPDLRNAFESKDSLQIIFLHLMGSHFQYHYSYPNDRNRFTADDIYTISSKKWLNNYKAGIIANYDNSILFTDSVLNCVIREIKDANIPSVMVYLSDHGENVYDDRDFRGRDPKFVSIPFLIYANSAYRAKNQDIIADMERSKATPFSTSELPQLLLHLSGIQYYAYDSIRDPLSPSFLPRLRYVDNKPYKEDSQRTQ